MNNTELRSQALEVLVANHRDGYTLPAPGLYPFQWCWDSGPIALGWAAAGRFEEAWSELHRLFSAQWPTGMVPHIVFWQDSDRYFPGPEVWGTAHTPQTTGLTQPPLPVSAAARLFMQDPDRDRARDALVSLWPRLLSWLSWFERARSGPHGAVVAVHPWESGMDNSPSWDEPLAGVTEASEIPLARRDVETVAADERPSELEYRKYLGIVERLRAAGWDTERQPADSPFVVEDPCLTAVTARAAADLVEVVQVAEAEGADGLDAGEAERLAKSVLAGLEGLWDEDLGWYRPYDVLAGRPVGAAASTGLVALWAGVAPARVSRVVERLDAWGRLLPVAVATADPNGPGYDPIRYWRGPVWVLVNWLVADGLSRAGLAERAEALRVGTRALVEQGFSEYYDPRDGHGIGGHGFSWSAALTLAWLTT
ncbi:MAG: alpha,alpha-trehalase [Acidimicrobiaceae bacterium]|nr:alpha,alpha-trehalase [Acidimicrobiaceae bacterium]